MYNSVTVSYLKHAFFKLSDKKTTVFIDPYSKIGNLNPPKLSDKPDIIAVTHEHPDHNNRDYASDKTYIVSNPGEYDIAEVSVVGVNSFHDKSKGQDRGMNTMYSINFNGVNFVHLGDLGDILDNSQIEDLGIVDVLFIPVGGHYTIDAKDAVKVIEQLNPNIIVPMHYKEKGDTQSPLAFIDDFLNIFPATSLEVETLEVNKTEFQDEDFETKVILFKDPDPRV